MDPKMALFTALCVFTFGFLRTAAVPPEASVFQKFSSSPEMGYHAPGFWQKDGEDLNEDVELRETLPNQDGSFQKKSILEGSPEDLQKHEYSVFTHGSLKGAINLIDPESEVLPIAVVYAVGGVLTFINFFAALLLWTKKPDYESAPSKAGEVQRGA